MPALQIFPTSTDSSRVCADLHEFHGKLQSVLVLSRAID